MLVQANFPPILQSGSVRGKGRNAAFRALVGRKEEMERNRQRRGQAWGCGQDSHELGNRTVASCLDHLQGGDMLRVDPRGDGLHTHTVKTFIAFFRTS